MWLETFAAGELRGFARVAANKMPVALVWIETETIKVQSDDSCVQSLAVKTTSAFDSPISMWKDRLA